MVVTGTENYTTTYDYTDVNGNYTALLQSETKVIDGVSEVTSYTYDAAGSQITKMDSDGKVQENIYNGFKQLLQVSEDGTEIASYSYNYGGMRNKKTVENQTIGQIWVGGQITVDANGYNAACYIRGAGLIAMQDYSNGQFTSPVYYLFDAHGNVVNLIDNEGEKIKTYRYDAFGVEKNPDENDTNPFRYCGEYFDKETGTIYLRARSYDPSIGRFTTRDSYTGRASDPLSLNLYTYCANNPVLYIDPSGYSYGTLPDGTKMSINSNWDAQLFYKEYNRQNAKSNPTSTTKLPNVSSSDIPWWSAGQQSGITAPDKVSTTTQERQSNIGKYMESIDSAPGCNDVNCSFGCRAYQGVTVIAREGMGNGGRFNAIISVYTPGSDSSVDFIGSTLPDNINGTYKDGGGYATIDEGTYEITLGPDMHVGAAFYRVWTLGQTSRDIPCERPVYVNGYGNTANGILVHRAEGGATSSPWSTGCITIEGISNMNKFGELVGSSAILIIER